MSSGASWQEQHRGTNAIGTALVEATGIAIHGAEHFFERNEFLTRTAVPILSEVGELMSVPDISGSQHSRQPHTLGLVNMASRMIENHLLRATCRSHVRLHLHAQPEGIGTVAEGIAVLSEDGWVVGGNRAAFDWLRISKTDLGTMQLKGLLDISLDELLSRHRRRPGQATQVRLRDGSALYALAQSDGSTMAVRAVPPAPVAQAGPTDALSSLDTGDQRWRSAADKARRVLDKSIPILIRGESGVGKELFARVLRDSSPRRELTPGPGVRAVWGACARRTAAPFFWMKSETCHLPCRRVCCACCRNAKSTRSGVASRWRLTLPCFAPPTVTCVKTRRQGLFAVAFTTASMA